MKKSMVAALAFMSASQAFAAVPDTVKSWFASTFAQSCDIEMNNEPWFQPEQIVGSEAAGTKVFRFTCMRGAYNITSVLVRTQEEGTIDALNFAEFQVDENYRTTGITTTQFLVNVSYEPETGTLHAFAKGRGIGDAFTDATYRLVGSSADPMLIKYVVDQTFDGEINPVTILDISSGR